MPEGYCWVCDRPAAEDPCPSCGTPQYQRPEAPAPDAPVGEVLDTAPVMGPSRVSVSPMLVVVIVVAVLVIMLLVFRSGAGIS